MVDAGCTYLWPVRVHVRESGRGTWAIARSERSLRGRAGTNLGIASRTGTPSRTRSSREGRSSVSTHGARFRSHDERVHRDSSGITAACELPPRWPRERSTRATRRKASRRGARGLSPSSRVKRLAVCGSRRRRARHGVDAAVERRWSHVDRAAGRDEGRPRLVVSGEGSSSSRGRGGSKHRGQTRETAPATSGHRIDRHPRRHVRTARASSPPPERARTRRGCAGGIDTETRASCPPRSRTARGDRGRGDVEDRRGTPRRGTHPRPTSCEASSKAEIGRASCRERV